MKQTEPVFEKLRFEIKEQRQWAMPKIIVNKSFG
jgi:hypothetical protein